MNAAAPHLSADDLDLLLEGHAPIGAASHLETCTACRALAASDRQVVAALAALPTWDPSPLFAERVLSQVARVPAQVAVAPAGPSARAQSARRRVWIGGSLVGGLVTAGFAWALIDPRTAVNLVEPAFQQLTQSLWLSLQAIAANTTEQPWFAPIRDAMATPARAVPALLGVAGVYLVLLLGLRRLLTRPATDAGW